MFFYFYFVNIYPIELLKTEYFNTDKNELGKLVIFTESVDTLTYLKDRLKNETNYRVLSITAENRNRGQAACHSPDRNGKRGES